MHSRNDDMKKAPRLRSSRGAFRAGGTWNGHPFQRATPTVRAAYTMPPDPRASARFG